MFDLGNVSKETKQFVPDVKIDSAGVFGREIL